MVDFGLRPVFIFGAGATKACGGPLTAEILPAAFEPPVAGSLKLPDLGTLVERCLIDHFHVPEHVSDRVLNDYPPLPLLLSLLDLAVDGDRPLALRPHESEGRPPKPDLWSRERLAGARAAIEYLIFAVLNERLQEVKRNYYADLFAILRAILPDYEPQAISLNYDILLDNALVQIADKRGAGDAMPAYGCDIRTPYRSRKKQYGRLLKLHGSLNWLYCACCHRLDLGMSDEGRRVTTCKVLDELYSHTSLDEHYGSHAIPCPECSTPMRAVMITPTQAKDYRNPHIQQIWYHAERTMREADHACFVGYSLPDDDIQVIDLLRRGLGHLAPDNITVVQHDQQTRALQDHPVGRRYRSIFGAGINWQPTGFVAWLESLSKTSGATVAYFDASGVLSG